MSFCSSCETIDLFEYISSFSLFRRKKYKKIAMISNLFDFTRIQWKKYHFPLLFCNKFIPFWGFRYYEWRSARGIVPLNGRPIVFIIIISLCQFCKTVKKFIEWKDSNIFIFSSPFFQISWRVLILIYSRDFCHLSVLYLYLVSIFSDYFWLMDKFENYFGYRKLINYIFNINKT